MTKNIKEEPEKEREKQWPMTKKIISENCNIKEAK